MIEIPFFLGGGALLLRVLRDFWLMRLVQNTPTAKIGSAALGLAELHGRVVPKEGVVSPIAQRPCLGWEVSICEEDLSDGQATSFNPLWKEIEPGVLLVAFLVCFLAFFALFAISTMAGLGELFR